MSITFFITLVLALIAVVYWRAVLMIACAVLLAMLVTGVSSVSQALTSTENRPPATAPVQPGTQPDGAPAGSGGPAVVPQDDPGPQGRPDPAQGGTPG